MLDGCERTTELIVGEPTFRSFLPAIGELRRRCLQENDLTTDPEYFIATNTQAHKRVAAVLIRRNREPEACVLFIEYCVFGIGLGIWRGGNPAGDGLTIGNDTFKVHYVHLATQALLQHWRIFGVSVLMKAPLQRCIEIMGPTGKYRMFYGRNLECLLPLESHYHAMLAGMGPRTRRSLAGKRRQLEMRARAAFEPSLEPAQALEAMLWLRPRSLKKQSTKFYEARYSLLRDRPDFFCMGMQSPDGTWLSILSGWRQSRVTYVDFQMNDSHFKKESLSAVMRAFMLEHEIAHEQQFIYFVGGTSLLLRRYCQVDEPSTCVFLWRPSIRATLWQMLIRHMKPESFYERVKTESGINWRKSGIKNRRTG
jgi:hypothetical protein